MEVLEKYPNNPHPISHIQCMAWMANNHFIYRTYKWDEDPRIYILARNFLQFLPSLRRQYQMEEDVYYSPGGAQLG